MTEDNTAYQPLRLFRFEAALLAHLPGAAEALNRVPDTADRTAISLVGFLHLGWVYGDFTAAHAAQWLAQACTSAGVDDRAKAHALANLHDMLQATQDAHEGDEDEDHEDDEDAGDETLFRVAALRCIRCGDTDSRAVSPGEKAPEAASFLCRRCEPLGS